MLLLTDNEITEIQGLSECRHLEYLSLKNNKIARIQGLDCLPLRYLNLVNTAAFYWLKCGFYPTRCVQSKLWNKCNECNDHFYFCIVAISSAAFIAFVCASCLLTVNHTLYCYYSLSLTECFLSIYFCLTFICLSYFTFSFCCICC